MRDAVRREVSEETGLRVDPGPMIGWVERIDASYHYVIIDFACTLVGAPSAAVAGDDATDVEWAAPSELVEWPLVEGLLDFLDDHGLR